MRLLLAVTDPVALSFVRSLLAQAGIAACELDGNMSIVEGSIGVLPRRLMVADDDHEAAERLLIDAGLGHELASAGESPA
ncbi:MAG: DUF2007 domain-containing protein [Rhodothalassiaceae bacterium]